MPELPEVESVRRGLEGARLRAPVAEVWRSRARLRIGAAWDRRHEHVSALLGATPQTIARRGKLLVWTFAAADAGEPLGLLVHLGMTGRFEFAGDARARPPHTHLELRFADRRKLRFVDPRRFGALRVAPLATLWATPPLSELGDEPFDPAFDGERLRARLGESRRPVRDALLDQRAVAGIGNIYAVEALWEAGVPPLAPCVRLGPGAWARLAAALVTVLARGLAAGGTTIRDYRGVDGNAGGGEEGLRAYGREGSPCPRCGATLRRFESGGRGGAACPREQRLGRGKIP
jgi:formamidopyrimidine-DNA glycosylase